ncbi:MAG: HTH-type transcriptional activator Btr [Verrucomicrobiae bacterium]|nr:HTH-type transcriptional activator Btr [Verrucomicrobiae bacterium]
MWLERTGVPNVWMLGRYDYTRAQPGLPAHQHRAAMEICFLVKGQQTYRVGNRDYILRGGDVFITFPNERHSTGDAPEEKGILYWMILRLPRAGQTFLGLPARQAGPLVRALLQIKPRHFRGAWDMKDLLDDILATYRQHSPLRAARMANRVTAFLLRVIECARPAPATRTQNQLLRYIEDHLTDRLTIPSLAAQAGLSVSRFKMRFKQDTGIPPGEYIQRAKIAAAKRRLARGHTTVTEVAHALGFASSQHFATVYKRFTGTTPSAILRAR